jgi:hypothetical protein
MENSMPRPLPADFIPTRRPREPSPDANKLKSYGFKEKYRVTSTVTQADLAKAEEMIVHAHQNPCMFHPDQYGTAVGVGSKKDTYMLGHHVLARVWDKNYAKLLYKTLLTKANLLHERDELLGAEPGIESNDEQVPDAALLMGGGPSSWSDDEVDGDAFLAYELQNTAGYSSP